MSRTVRSRSARAKADDRPWWKRPSRWWLAIAVPGLVLAILGGAFLLVLTVSVPLPEDIAPGATTVFDASGNVVGSLTDDATRRDIELADLDDTTRLAVLAAEDRDFYQHGGVSPLGVARAMWVNVRSGRLEQGGSTITQQYVKNAVVGTERSLWRKVREAALALRLDREYPKDTVLEWYLNTIYWGRGAYGIGAASQTYFGVGAADLELNQAATLAGIIQSPENLDPLENPDRVDGRRRYVLDGMLEQGWISSDAHAQVIDAGLPDVASTTAASASTAPYYLDTVRRELTRVLGGNAAARDLRVYTALDLDLQQEAERIIRDGLANTDLQAEDLSAGVVVADPRTGDVRAVVGGPDFSEQPFNSVVQGRRQVGSTFKALTLAAFVDDGWSTFSRYDAPSVLPVDDDEDGIRDYAGRDRGRITVREATAVSANTVFAQVQQEIGADAVVDVATRLGMPEEMNGQDAFAPRGSSMTLGSNEFTPWELAQAYATLANDGMRVPLHTVLRVEDRDGNVLYAHDDAGEQAIDPNVARVTTESLRGVIEFGTGGSASLGRPAAGKTGTTQRNADGWFAGYVPQLTAVTWVGRLGGNQGVDGLSGSGLPAQLWHEVMVAALDGVPAEDFPGPDLAGLDIKNPPPSACPEGSVRQSELEAQSEGDASAADAPPDGGPEGDGQPSPAETRTEVLDGTDHPEAGPCVRVTVIEPTPTPTDSPSPSDSPSDAPTETEPPLPTESPSPSELSPSDSPSPTATDTASPTPA